MADTIDKLIKLARGDVALVAQAIRDAVRPGESKADLKRVVEAIVALRAPPPPTP